jgi:cell division septal protein FtsQ
MARQKKFKKMHMPKALEGAKDFFIKRLAGISVIIGFIILAWVLIAAFLERSDYFKIRSVEARGASEPNLIAIRSELLRYYKDKNIFKIDIRYIAKGFEGQYPDAKYIAVKRVLPDKLLVDLTFRRPVALLTNGKYYPVDRSGVILVNMDPMKTPDLPRIIGVDIRLAGRPHKKNESKELEAALSLIDEIKKARFLEKYRVRLIDASDIKNLSFYLGDGGPAVIIGYENLKTRLNALRDALRDSRVILERINYIDIRFKDVAISPK